MCIRDSGITDQQRPASARWQHGKDMDKPLVGADAGCAAHDRAHENVGMKLALDQAADAAILNTGDGGFDSTLFTFGIDDVRAGKVPWPGVPTVSSCLTLSPAMCYSNP